MTWWQRLGLIFAAGAIIDHQSGNWPDAWWVEFGVAMVLIMIPKPRAEN